jgi:ribosomal protein S17E
MTKIVSRTFKRLRCQTFSVNKGTITQLTSITTPVTCNTAAGNITTVSSTLAAGASATFKVNNTVVDADSCVVANISNYSGTTGVPVMTVDSVSSDEFSITITNVNDTNPLNGTMKISFFVC